MKTNSSMWLYKIDCESGAHFVTPVSANNVQMFTNRSYYPPSKNNLP